jgi:hypothetical protein
MPYKLRDDRRHKFEKVKFEITNWSQYNQALKDRGAITLSNVNYDCRLATIMVAGFKNC